MCGCGKKGITSRVPHSRPSIGPLSVQGGVAAGPTPASIRAMNLQMAQGPKTTARLDQARLEIMKKRREVIRNKFNK